MVPLRSLTVTSTEPSESITSCKLALGALPEALVKLEIVSLIAVNVAETLSILLKSAPA